jgi:hypothetical protein
MPLVYRRRRQINALSRLMRLSGSKAFLITRIMSRTSLCSALYKATGHSATAAGVEHSASPFARWLLIIRVLIGRIASARQRRFSARRVAERHRVPGVGRQRGTELVKLGFHTLQDVLQAGSDQLLDILKKLADGDSTLKGIAVMTVTIAARCNPP